MWHTTPAGAGTSDDELWELFLDLLKRNVEQLGQEIRVDPGHQPARYIVRSSTGRTYQFYPDKARDQGLGVVVIEAVNRIRGPRLTPVPKYRPVLWW